MIELTQIADQMQKKINDLQKLRIKLPDYVKKRAETSSEYDKQLAVVIIRLRNGQEFELEGVKIKDPPITIIEKIAKGIISEYALKKDEAEGMYKAITSNIDTLKAELNGYQSIYRHLEQT